MFSNEVACLHDEYIAAWQRDDGEMAMSFWDDDIVMRAPGSNPHSGVYRGKVEVQRNLIDRIYEETTEAEVLGLIDRGIGNEYVFTIVHERFKKLDGRLFETKRVVIYRWVNKKIVKVLYFDPDQAASDAFWSA
jgi:ketosteroid isomerase-like protein